MSEQAREKETRSRGRSRGNRECEMYLRIPSSSGDSKSFTARHRSSIHLAPLPLPPPVLPREYVPGYVAVSILKAARGTTRSPASPPHGPTTPFYDVGVPLADALIQRKEERREGVSGFLLSIFIAREAKRSQFRARISLSSDR